MANTTLPALLDTGDHASRPAASAVGSGGLYSCTDHDLVYQTDGSAWSTWATLGASAAASVSITDAGIYFTGTDVEAALQELGAASGSGGVIVQDEGSPLTTTATTLDFVGAGVTATGSGATKTITIPGGGGSVTDDVDAAASLFNYANFR